ncbi:hypothetical protein ACHAPJ_002592 [Fusarium lateritium]
MTISQASKKDRKHARESGGIAAAVTKQTAGKFASSNNGNNTNKDTNTNTNSGDSNQSKSSSTSVASTPPVDTPEIKPSSGPDNVNPAVSPMLAALSTTPASVSTAPSMNNEWMRNGMAGSPGNLISIMGDSPPTQPSSYEDQGRLHHGWATQRPYMSPSPASLSPPNHSRRPLSFQMDAQYQSPETPPLSAPYRRSSIASPFPGSRMGSQPPLPHQHQAHFYGVPDIDLNVTNKSGMKAGDRGYFFGFDKLPECPDFPVGPSNVVIAGYEGGLDVYAVGKRGLEPVASLKGLRGGVHHAKILPWTLDNNNKSLFPLVAVVLHGPVLPSAAPGQEEGASPRPDGAASPRSVFTQQEGFPGRRTIDAYQTSVEVYSLKTNQPVDVLLQAPKISINPEISVTNPIFRPPPPSGSFTIQADSGTLAVCSGITGECWVYLQLLEDQNGHVFTCVGKIWTSLQQSTRGEVPEEADKTRSSTATSRPSPQTPILAISGKWISYCPSTPSSQVSVRAHVPLPILGKAPGLATVTPPQLPTTSASVDLPISDSVVNKIMRETTQELIQGAKWVGQQGWQAWNSYWNKPTNPQLQTQQARSPPQGWAGTRSPRGDPTQFPPTHGSAGQAVAKEPGLVSIIDAEALPASSSIHPITTFAPPLGCSFLSFSPSSLALFTASSKGDVQTVWDLLRIQHTRSSPLQATVAPNTSTGPQVRQIAQFSRMTVARIVDVAWTQAQGERLAMVTERGTVHLLDMPSSAFMWPAPRRRQAVQESGTATPEQSNTAVSLATGAFGAAYQAAKPFVSRPRRSSANVPNAGNTLKDSAAMGGRVIAASISNSLGKTGTAINQLRHTGENRVSLPLNSSLPSASCVTWVRSRRHQGLFVVGDGLVRAFSCRTRRSSVQAGRRVTRASRYHDYNVPILPSDLVAPAVRQMVDLGAQDEILDLSDRDMDAGNTLTLNARPRVVSADHSMESSIPQAEIESSAPYQPFHTDRRVTLCEYRRGTTDQLEVVSAILAETTLEENTSKKKKKKGQPAESGASREASNTTAWAFGQDIPVVRLDLGLPTVVEEEYDGSESHLALPPSAMERVMQYGDEEQIVVTTRRRRGAQGGGQGEDGFFEDDCEVLDFADQRV